MFQQFITKNSVQYSPKNPDILNPETSKSQNDKFPENSNIVLFLYWRDRWRHN